MDFVGIICSEDASRDTSIEDMVASHQNQQSLLQQCVSLHEFQLRPNLNLYLRVRALMILHALFRYYITPGPASALGSHLVRLFNSGQLDLVVNTCMMTTFPPSSALCSIMSASYRLLAFQALSAQVKKSVQNETGNAWLFDASLPQPTWPPANDIIILERTPVRLDLSHAGWSDIFFLAMDCPHRAHVVNVSVNLTSRRGESVEPPVEVYVRRLAERVVVLRSVDLMSEVRVENVEHLFDFSRDLLGLLKAAVIASGAVPPWTSSSLSSSSSLPGLEVTSRVASIPKGSRLAVSTTLLACAIAALMRLTGQAPLEGPLQDQHRRLVCSRAILGEWLAGSGGGWQDSAGVFPMLKEIRGVAGELLPKHILLPNAPLLPLLRQGLVVCHAGMASNVGPILEQVTEKYLLRSKKEWEARLEAGVIYERIRTLLTTRDDLDALKELGALLTRNFLGPVCTIIPEAHNAYTQELLNGAAKIPGFLGFAMHGGISGGGCGFLFEPLHRKDAETKLLQLMRETKKRMESSIAFAMDPVVYDWSVNEQGTVASLVSKMPDWNSFDTKTPQKAQKVEVSNLPQVDPAHHERIQSGMRSGVLGLEKNCLSGVRMEDVASMVTISTLETQLAPSMRQVLSSQVGVAILCGGLGTRWSRGSGTVKALSPFIRMGGHFRSFLDIHIQKMRHANLECPIFICTSYLTHDAIAEWAKHCDYPRLYLCRGNRAGRRMIPMVRDLQFHYRQHSRVHMDGQKEQAEEQTQRALMDWAREQGEASDYCDEADPMQQFHPLGHFHEFFNLASHRAFGEVRHIMMHNVDTLGAHVGDERMWRMHEENVDVLMTMECVERRHADAGGIVARVNGKEKVVEGLAVEGGEETEAMFKYYSTNTCWIRAKETLTTLMQLKEGTIPTYITIKEVKKSRGNGHEDIFPLAQAEQLWGDTTTVIPTQFVCVPQLRGQQLKDVSQLDPFIRDGSAKQIADLCGWSV